MPSRAQAQRLIDEELVTVNGEPVRPSHKLKGGEVITCLVPEPEPLDIQARDIPLKVVYQDDHVAVVDKPAGMVVHPAPGNWDGTLVHALLHHLTGLSGIGGRERPGIVHRLDKDTSGLLIVAKTDAAHSGLSKAFKAHQLDRRYRVLVAGVPTPPWGTIDLPLGRDPKDRKRMSGGPNQARHAITHYRTLESFGHTAYLECKLETGRTHQIRVHLTDRGWPVLGDPVYGGRKAQQTVADVPRQMLHAYRLAIAHPVTGEELLFESPLPEDFQSVLDRLREGAG